ncbi:MAG TPA: ferritin-like domain-containing protein [Polyangiaceae bacterium]|nr:ferritin-like domain-containing protein [Polyangiaceae bacterium]
MRQRELRRFFVRLAALASPISVAAGACGGDVLDETHSTGPTDAGTGGYPVFMGLVGEAAAAGGSGGYPVYVGSGGYPVYLGTGGGPVGRGGAGPTGDASAPYVDAAVNACGRLTFVPWPRDAGDPLATCAVCDVDSGTYWGHSCEKVVLDGELRVRCSPLCPGGRRPPGLAASRGRARDELTAFFEEMSRLEAASVPAFRTLARELRAHGAPRSLRRSAKRAARDEIRHARLGTLLAERFGGTYVRPDVTPRPLRSVEEIATDNATEGCVRETFGAMIATWQARVATDPVVRGVMRRVAVDETRHAALALRVAKWADRRLDAAARARVVDARRRAARDVMAELQAEPSRRLVSIAGLPQGHEARSLASSLHDALWA